MKNRVLTIFASVMLCGTAAAAGQVEVPIHKVTSSGVGEKIGTITATDTEHGVILTPDIQGLGEGLHGFHVHENSDCSAAMKDGEMTAAAAAGGHLNPGGEGEHRGPYRKGHPGDLPALYVDANGNARHPVLAPRIEIRDLSGRALMIHKGGDTYTPQPELGGGGDRVACGVVQS